MVAPRRITVAVMDDDQRALYDAILSGPRRAMAESHHPLAVRAGVPAELLDAVRERRRPRREGGTTLDVVHAAVVELLETRAVAPDTADQLDAAACHVNGRA